MRTRLICTASMMVAAVAPAIAQQQERVAVGEALEAASTVLNGLAVPKADEFVVGNREIAAGTTVNGPIAIVGTLRIAGTVNGDVYAYHGDVVLLSGGHVTGSAVALTGKVMMNGGVLDGDGRSLPEALQAVAPVSVAEATKDNVLLTLGWTGVVLIIGIGVMVFGGRTLDVVGETIDQQFGKSFLVGLGATLGIIPVLALLLIGLALTILGLLLIPFAIVAYVLAVFGLVTLGFLAAMRVTGRSLTKGNSRLGERGGSLRALVVGVAFFLGLWLVAAIATPWPAAESVARVLAFAISWAAATVGLGATIISRAGARPGRTTSLASPVAREAQPAVAAPASTPEWLTPTPVSGVVAARRPTPPPQRT